LLIILLSLCACLISVEAAELRVEVEPGYWMSLDVEVVNASGTPMSKATLYAGVSSVSFKLPPGCYEVTVLSPIGLYYSSHVTVVEGEVTVVDLAKLGVEKFSITSEGEGSALYRAHEPTPSFTGMLMAAQALVLLAGSAGLAGLVVFTVKSRV